MSLKEILEGLWADTKVRCPGHRVWWLDDEELTYHKRPPRGLERADEGLFYARGEKVVLENSKGKL